MAKLKCPKCKSTNLQLLASDKNMKEKTSLNLNPLEPFTVFNKKKKKKISAAKIGLAMMTWGTSALLTGTKNNKNNEYFCTNCGNRWIGK